MRVKPSAVLIDVWPARYRDDMRGIVKGTITSTVDNFREQYLVRWDHSGSTSWYGTSLVEEVSDE